MSSRGRDTLSSTGSISALSERASARASLGAGLLRISGEWCSFRNYAVS
jgi:hypothetical protein